MSQYSLGKVSVTNGSPVVTGTGTSWSSALAVNQLFALSNLFVWYTIKSVDSSTQITLTGNYVGATNASASYVVQRDFTPNNSYPIPSYGDVGSATLITQTLLSLDTQLTALSVAAQTIQGNIIIDGTLTISGTGIGYNEVDITNSIITGGSIDNAIIGGTTPSGGIFNTIRATYSVEQGANGSYDAWNAYYGTSSWIYRNTDYAYLWRHNAATFSLDWAPSGVAGATATFNHAIVIYGDTGAVSFPSGVITPADWQHNRMINGGFDIWQSGTSFVMANGLGEYTADQVVIFNETGVSMTVSKVNGFSSQSALNILANAVPANGYFTIAPRIEAQQVADLAGQTCSLSFDILATTTVGTLTGYIQFVTNGALDSSTFNVSAQAVTFTIPTGEGRVTILLPPAATAGLQYGAQLNIPIQQLGGTGNVNVTIGAIQLEKGAVANAYVSKGMARELQDCRRFFKVITLPPMTMLDIYAGTAGQNAAWTYTGEPMRVSPSLYVSPPLTVSNMTANPGLYATPDIISLNFQSLATGRAYVTNNTNTVITASSRL